MRCQK